MTIILMIVQQSDLVLPLHSVQCC